MDDAIVDTNSDSTKTYTYLLQWKLTLKTSMV